MPRAISYFIFSSNGSYLRWDDDTTIDFRIRQYEMSITGGGGVDRLYVGAGTKVDAGALFASANTDELYFSGNFSDYTQTISAGGVYTFTGLVGGSHANEVVSFSMNSNGDKLVFANGHITVKSSDYLSVSGSYSSISAGSLTLLAQTDPVIGAQPGNKPAKVFVFDAGGINIPQLPIVGEAIAVSGGGGVDKFYVRKGTHADAIGLFASAGQDVLYLTGRFGDYTQTKSAGGVYTFTRNFTNADASLTEVVSFSMNSSGDQLVFADGGVTLRLADYLSGGSYADITVGQLNPLITTPGLLATPTPNLILASDTGSSASDRITNNATINVTGLVTGGTWQYQVDSSAWATGTASSFTATSGAHSYFVRQFDMAGLSSGVSTAVTYTLDTSPPSALGSVATSANVAENSRGAVTLTANANDVPASTSVTWSLDTGLDSALFDITSAGVLSFKIAPNYEMPRGSAFNADSNNDAYTVNVIATDAAGNASAPSAIVVNVTDVNEAPVAVMIPARAATQHVAFSYDVSGFFSDRDTQASDATWRTLTYTATGLPSGLTIADSSGVISGMPSATTANPATVTVTATDGLGLNVTQTFTLSVVDAPIISSFTVSDTTTANGAQLGRSGEALVFVVTMSEAVTVTPATGAGAVAPQITFSVNGQAVTATYASGSNSNMLTFSGGTVPASGDGTAISVTSMALNSGTVTSNSSGRGWVSTTVGQTYAGYTVDNTAPLAPSLTLASDTGSSASDRLTNNVTIKVGGLESGATWQYQEDNSAWAAGTGSSFTASTGAHSYLVRQTDAAGNTSDTSTATYTFDTSAPATPSLTLASDTGSSASDSLTSNVTINVSALETGTTWQYQVDNGTWVTGTASNFTASEGTHSYWVRQTDAAGNTSAASTAVIYTLDTTPPSAPTITTPIAGDNTVTASEASAGVSIQGTAEANASLTLTLYQVSKTVTANASGAWSLTFDATDWGRVGRGVHTLTVATATAPDLAGNVSVMATTLTVANDVPLREILLTSIAAGRGGFAITGEAVEGGSGSSVSAAGDVNGDGLADFIIGAPWSYGSYVVFGKANWSGVSTLNLNTIAAGTGGFAITGEAAYGQSGYSVAAAGDINGDGLTDLLVGAPDAGRSYVVFGRANWSGVSTLNLNTIAMGTGGFAITGEARFDQSGSSVSAAGDINGDGLADLLVGALGNDAYAGRSYVVFGRANWSGVSTLNLNTIAMGTGGFAISGEAADDESGSSVSAAGDINGDGLADLLVGAPGNDAYAGRSYVVFGRANWSGVSTLNLNTIAMGTGGFAITGELVSDQSGFSVSAAGDINGDGLADLLVSAPYNDEGGGNAGRTYVVFGRAHWSGVSTLNLNTIAMGTGGFAITGEANFDLSGYSVSAAGDINGDGLADLLVGASGNDAGGSDAGRSYVVYGKTDTSAVNLSAVAAGTGGFAITGEVAGDKSGFSVSAAGDINGDGLADLLVGAPGNAAGGTNAGRSYVIFGGTQWISNAVQGSGTVTGTSASEAIIGSSGADTLTGGGGVDRFFAGAGNDVIVLTTSDISNLASNTPTVVTGGSVLTTVDGGTGIDTIRLIGGASLDLRTISNTSAMNPKTTSRIASIERIDLATDSAANTLGLRVNDVLDMAGFNSFNTGNGWTNTVGTALSANVQKHQLVIDGTALDTLALASSEWVRQSDTVTGNVNGASQTYNVYINQAKNAMLLVDADIVWAILPPVLQLNSDTGLSATDGITNNATIVVTELAAGATWSYQVDSTAGAWTSGTGSSFTATSGAHSYFVRQIDAAGNTSAASTAVIYTLDTTSPSAPTITTPIAGDNIVTASEASAGVSIQGTAEANASVTLTLYQVSKTVTANASGAWSMTLDATDLGRVGRGVHTLMVATAPDLAGNVSVVATTLTVANDVPLREILLTSIAAGRGGFAITGEAAYDGSGSSVSAAGDVNGDGLADLLVGAPYNNAGGGDAGRSYVVFGRANWSGVSTLNLNTIVAGTGGFAITGEAAYDKSGSSVSAAGDINGDGLADLLVGALGNDAYAGRSYVVFGRANWSGVSTLNLSTIAMGTGGFAITGEAMGDLSGLSVSAAGDVNGDGLSDLLVGALNNDAGGSNAGRSYVVFGKTDTNAVNLSAVAAGTGGFAITGEAADDQSGSSVSAAGDVNGDGLADFIIGAPWNYGSYVVFGKANWSGVSTLNLNTIAAGTGGFAITGETVGGGSGYSVSAAGDVNGDGLTDLLVGAPYNDASGYNAGRTYVVFGRANWSGVSTLNLSTIAMGTGGFAITGEATRDKSGYSVSAAGDINGDGLSDLLVGASDNSAGGSDAGRSYVVYGKTDTSAVNLSAVAVGTGGFAITGEAADNQSGYSVSAAGDINGDGLADLLVGAPGNAAGGTNAGRGYVIFGGTQWISNAVQGSGTVTGTSASEAIIGSSGADTLTGGGGVDRFFGGAGNDVIVFTVSDITNLARNTPTAVTGGSVLTTVDGGTGIDTIRLFGGANLDLTAISNTSSMNPKTLSRIAGIECIDLATDTAANTLGLRVNDVLDMADFNSFNTGNGWSNVGAGTALSANVQKHQLVVDGTALDTLALASSEWVRQSDTVTGNVNGASQTYNVYINQTKNAMLLVDADIVRANLPPVLQLNSDTGLSANDGITNNATIVVTELIAGATWSYQVDSTAGAWTSGTGSSFTATSGAHSYFVRQIDAAGNTSTTSTPVIYTFDNSAPATPSLTLASDTGSSASDRLTSNITIKVGGLESGTTWQYQVDATAGSWVTGTASSFTATSGAHSYWVRQTDAAGNTSAASTAVIYTLDTTPPSTTITTPIAGDNIVTASEASTGVNIQGTADANASVTLTLYQVSKTVTADAGGAWSTTFDATDWGRVGRGVHTLTVATAPDLAGNVGVVATTTLTVANDVPLREILLTNIDAGRGGFAITDEAAYYQNILSVSAAGDINGDGLTDLLVGLPNAGRSYVVFGKTDTNAVNLRAVAAGTSGFAITGEGYDRGSSVSAAGDVNGDGLADLLVGVRGNNANTGRSYVVFGRTNWSGVSTLNLSTIAMGTGGFAITGEAAGDQSGSSVSAAGDVNGDGLADLLVGAPRNDAGGSDAGRSYVVFGRANWSGVSTLNLSTIAMGTGGFAITGEAADDWSGSSVSAAGDVNGDGLADLLVGAPYNSASGYDAGCSYVVFGRANWSGVSTLNLTTIAMGTGGFTITGEAILDRSGLSVSAADDVNGDGLADLLVGVRANNADTGRSYVVFGKSSTTAVNLGAVAAGTGGFAITGEVAGDESGYSVSAAGDVNGDGLADLLVGAPYYNNAGGSGAGRSYVVYGKTDTSAVNLSAVAAGTGGFAITGYVADDLSGFSVSAAGDINGDGRADLLIGAPGNDTYAGRSYVIFGGTQWISNTVQGSDTVTGTAANEAIIGSSSADTLTGGGGVDRFFAGAGNDVIVLTSSDVTNLTSNTPTTVAGGSVLSTVDGGTGLDTIRLIGGANLDLTAISNTSGMNPKTTSRIASIERIDLASDSAANTLTLSVNDVLDMAGFNSFNTGNGWTNTVGTALSASVAKHQLVIDGTATDNVRIKNFLTAWTQSQTVSGTNDTVSRTENGATRTYHVYNSVSGNTQLLIDSRVTPMSTPPEVASFTVSDTTAANGAQLGKAGEALVFVATMSEAVTVTPATGAGAVAPQITFSVNGQAVTANYASGSGTAVLTFTGGTVPATGSGTAISVTSIALNGGTVTGNLSTQPWLTSSVGQTYAGYTVDNTAPTVNTTTFNAAENSTAVGNLVANETVTWSLGAAGADTSRFNLTNGVLTFATAPNFEAPRGAALSAANNNAYTVNVNATDTAGNVRAQAIVVNVTDVNEAPTVLTPTPASSVLLNQAANLNVAGAFSDPDSVNTYAVGSPQWGTLTYVTTGLPSGLTINATTGVIGGAATATTASAASVTVTATDGGGSSVTETFNLSVVSAPTLSTATPPSTALTGGGDGVGDTIVLTITFDGVVNGLTSGTDNTIFKVAATGVSAVWGGITGTATRTLTYTVAAGQNGQATLDEAALKTALVAGISDAAGNAFAYSGAIADIDSTPLPVVSTVAAATSALVASPSLDNVTNLDMTSALAIAFDYLYDSSLGGGSSTAASNYRSANGSGVYAQGSYKSTLMQTDYPYTTEDGNMDLGIETDYRLGYNAVIFG